MSTAKLMADAFDNDRNFASWTATKLPKRKAKKIDWIHSLIIPKNTYFINPPEEP